MGHALRVNIHYRKQNTTRFIDISNKLFINTYELQ